MSTKVKVAVRVRPTNKREIALGAHCVVDMQNNQTILEGLGKKSKKTFAFDHCFWSIDSNNPKFSGQEDVFKALGLDILDNAFEGYNACIFAYGQTGKCPYLLDQKYVCVCVWYVSMCVHACMCAFVYVCHS